MKKTKTLSLAAIRFYTKRLYKYIRSPVKVFQNHCPPPHGRAQPVTPPPIELILSAEALEFSALIITIFSPAWQVED